MKGKRVSGARQLILYQLLRKLGRIGDRFLAKIELHPHIFYNSTLSTMAMIALRSYGRCLQFLIAFVLLHRLYDTAVFWRSAVPSSHGDASSVDSKVLHPTPNISTIDMWENPYWWKPYVDQVARPFPILGDNGKLWCIPRRIHKVTSLRERHVKSGLYMVKVEKTASSTSAGVTIQIARNVAEQQYKSAQPMECTYHAAHGRAYAYRQDPYFMWTVLRDTRKRALSHYNFFVVSREKAHNTPHEMIQRMQEYKSLQLKSVSNRYFNTRKHATARDIVDIMRDDVFGSYGFVGLSDRMDETLVALKFILGVELQDIVVLSSKRSGGFDGGKYKNTCFKIQSVDTPPEVEEFLQEEFPRNNHDYFLHAVVNRSLDLTIDAIGRKRFQRDLDTFRKMSQYAEAQCLDKAVFPCVAEGKPPLPEADKSCFFGDIGCGHACVQEALQNFDR